ncbi:MAG: ribosomal RNA small subunit methyltransferase A [Opitutae bacterium]|nr:ribosomal RNA small subunit methyltransferase A [Opitutae bacterium]|tara:strand:+ start:3412 stop:4257 length:846 start_codon:yes stop_codon:yes gene_type:complete
MALSPSKTSELLRQLEHRPNKKLGQNFLIDGNLVEKSISMASLPTNYPVLEIGPGLGTLTSHLLNLGHTVYAVEIDRRLEAHLREILNSFIESGQFNLVRADAVKQPIGNLPDDITEYSVVANLPYAISSAWLESLLGSEKLPTSMVMMLQKEATERMLAPPGTKAYNALAIFLQASYQQRGYHSVPGQCFYPAPAVASALLKMEKKTEPYLFAKETRSLIRRIFTQRRKQIGSLLKKEEHEIQQIMTSWLEENNICSTTRPEKISVDQWIKLGGQFPSTN